MKRASTEKKSAVTIRKYLSKGNVEKFPKDIKPMLATLVDRPVEEPVWFYEVKWDGYRAIAYLNKGDVEIRSRNNKSFNEKFYSIHDALVNWKINAVVDGEIIVENKRGISDFANLQAWRSEADGQLVYFLFDVLWLEGVSLLGLPYNERHELLKLIAPDSKIIKVSEGFETPGNEFFKQAEAMQLEGIVGKKSDSKYYPGARSKDWIKIKTEKRQEAVIGGYTRNENSTRKISALLMGQYENGELKYTGSVGTGFSDQMQKEILLKLKSLKTSKCLFKDVPEYNKPSRFRPNPPKAEVTWVKPMLVAEISYRTISNDGSFRHPSFKSLREDKDAKEVSREIPEADSDFIDKKSSLKSKKLFKKPDTGVRRTLLNPNDETQVRNILGNEMKFTNLSKVYWPAFLPGKQGRAAHSKKGNSGKEVTKREMINYYYRAAPFMLPYMTDRPQTLNRHPNGIHGKTFYQKDVTGKIPDWIKTFPYFSEHDGRMKNFLLCTDEASLLYIASLGCIEMNPWSSRIQSPGNPDWCIIDLDPDKNTFDQVVSAAQVTKKILDAVDVPCCCKTSGSTGLHIYIPLGAKYTYEQSKEFGRVIARIVNEETQEYTSIERLTKNRKGKMYIDFLQNRPQATLAAPYSLRPKPGAPVSMPLHWEEVKKGLQILDFNIFNAIDRLEETGDIFKPVLGKGISLEKTLKKIKTIFDK